MSRASALRAEDLEMLEVLRQKGSVTAPEWFNGTKYDAKTKQGIIQRLHLNGKIQWVGSTRVYYPGSLPSSRVLRVWKVKRWLIRIS